MDFCFWVVESSRGFFYVWNLKEVCQVGEVSSSSSLLFLSLFLGVVGVVVVHYRLVGSDKGGVLLFAALLQECCSSQCGAGSWQQY